MKTFIRILKILAYIGTILVALVGLFALFTQTQFFKDRVRILLVSTLAEQMNGTVHLGTMGGNFLNEITFDSVDISYQERPVLTSGKVILQYDLLPLLENKLRVRYFIIEQPKMYIVRSQKGTWNFENVFKPSSDTSTHALTWAGTVDDIELKNGMLTILDSASLLAPGSPASIEYHNCTIKDINIQLRGTFKKDAFTVRLIHASMYSDRPQFELTHCKGDFTLDTNGVSASNTIIQTGRSYLEMDAKLQGTNIFRGLDLARMRNNAVQLQLKSSNLDLNELKLFLPEVDFLEGSTSIDLHAGGIFGDLDIQSLHLKTFQSTLNLSGTVKNLHHPSDLYLNIALGESEIHGRDLTRLMPSFPLPPFDSTGNITLYAQFAGKPLEFASKAIVRTSFGAVDVSGKMNLARTLPTYDLTFTTVSLDVSRIIPDVPPTSLSLHGNVKGEGFSIDSMRSALFARFESSSIRELRIDSAQLDITALPHRITGSATVQGQSMRADVNVEGKFFNVNMPEFTSEVSLSSFNLATLLNDNRFTSDLTLRGTIAGSGSTIDNFSTDSKLTLLASTFRGHSLDQQEIHLFLDQHDPENKHLSVGSSIADIDFSGRFDLDYAAAVLPEHLVNLINATRDHALPPESVKTILYTLPIAPHTAAQRRMRFDYTTHIKDLGPIATLFSPTPFNARADLSGTMTTTNDVLSFTCNGIINEFYIGSADSGAIVSDCSIRLRLDSLVNRDPLEQLLASVDLHFTSGMVNALRLDSSDLALRYSRSRGKLSLQGSVDSLYRVLLSGETSIQPGTYVFDVDTLLFSSGRYAWRNNQDVQFRLNSEGTRVMHAEMVRNEEVTSLAGGIQYSGDIDLTAGLRNFDLAGLGYVLPAKELSQAKQGFTGTVNADIHVYGSVMNPRIAFNAVADQVTYRQTQVGAVRANISYKDTLAAINITVAHSSQDTVPSLTIRGDLPINLALSGVEQRFPDIPQNLHIVSQGFNLAVLDPLLREFDDLSGTLTSDVAIGGTPRTPEFGGLITLSDVKFIFTPNNVPYALYATLQPSGDRIILQHFLLRNAPQDNLTGEAQLTGSFSIKDYKISTFDVTATGQLLVMSEATRRTSSTLYGPLLTETDANGLTLSGTLERPFLSGKLLVRDANLLSPPTKGAETSTQLALNRIVIDDTSKARVDSSALRTSKFFTAAAGTLVGPLRPRTLEGVSLVDRLRYNLTVETQGTTAIKMIFTPATSEELYAELEGSVSVINNNGVPSVYGEITVLPSSYYYFFRKFEADGKLKFVGQWDNPELNVTARYESRYAGSATTDQSKSLTSFEAQKFPYDQRVVVILDITGTRYDPRLAMSLKAQRPGTTGDENLDDWSRQARGGDVQSDAISFILTGKFRDDLTSNEQRDVASSVGATAGNTLTSSVVSGFLTDVLRREFPAIRSAEFSYDNGRPNVRVTGEAFKGRFQVGANLQDQEGRGRFDPNLRYQISVGEITANRSLRNLFIELQRRDINFNDDRKTYETRIYYRFSF